MNIDKNSPYFSKLFLELITRDTKFKNDLQSAFPEIYADVESYKNNPNCSCRSKIESFVNVNKDRASLFVEGWIATNSHITVDFNEIVKKYFVTHVTGKIYRIAKTDEAFAEFYRKMIDEKFVYKSVTSAVDGDQVVFYFF